MRKAKAVFVTALCALMLALILVGLYMLEMKVYLIIVALLGVYGFLCAAFNFCQWLGREYTHLPAPPEWTDWEPDEEF